MGVKPEVLDVVVPLLKGEGAEVDLVYKLAIALEKVTADAAKEKMRADCNEELVHLASVAALAMERLIDVLRTSETGKTFIVSVTGDEHNYKILKSAEMAVVEFDKMKKQKQ